MDKILKCRGIRTLNEKEQESFERLINEEDIRHIENIEKICRPYGFLSLKVLYELSKSQMEAIEEAARKTGIEHLLKE